jgi:hypothetical protein
MASRMLIPMLIRRRPTVRKISPSTKATECARMRGAEPGSPKEERTPARPGSGRSAAAESSSVPTETSANDTSRDPSGLFHLLRPVRAAVQKRACNPDTSPRQQRHWHGRLCRKFLLAAGSSGTMQPQPVTGKSEAGFGFEVRPGRVKRCRRPGEADRVRFPRFLNWYALLLPA